VRVAGGANQSLWPADTRIDRFHQISKVYTHYAAVALFFFFGLKTLYDAFFKKDEVRFSFVSVKARLNSRPH
jgi:hypothetical protein